MPGPIGLHLISEDDTRYEQEILASPYDIAAWLKYYRAKANGPAYDRIFLLERAVHQFPRSYKFWTLYLDLRVLLLDTAHPHFHARQFARVNALFDRALVHNHALPLVWLRYLAFLRRQTDITRTRRTFNRCLQALPLTQHGLIWPHFLNFAASVGGSTAVAVYRRYYEYDPTKVQMVIEQLVALGDVDECLRILDDVLSSPEILYNPTIIDKSPLDLWSDFCDAAMRGKPRDTFVENLVANGLARFPDQVSRLYVKLSTYFAKRKNFRKASEYFEKGLKQSMTVKDFTLIFDTYLALLEGLIEKTMERVEERERVEEIKDHGMVQNREEGEQKEVSEVDHSKSVVVADLDLQMAQFENLMDRRPFLLNDVLLRQNPHSVDDWMARFALYGPAQLEAMLADMVRSLTTISPFKGKALHRIWLRYAGVYEANGDLVTARVIFDRAIKVEYGTVEELVEVWSGWCDMELRHDDFDHALRVLEQVLFIDHVSKQIAPSVVEEARKISFKDANLKPQQRVFKSVKLWTLYLDLMESMGDDPTTIDQICQAYESILRMKIATPVVIVNYANFLESVHRFEQSFTVYEKGVALFKFPVNYEIWNIYLSKVLARQAVVSNERIRDLFEQALESCSVAETTLGSSFVKAIVLSYGNWEISMGFSKRAFRMYEKLLGQKSILATLDRFDLRQIYLKQALASLGVPETRKLYESALSDEFLSNAQIWQLTEQLVDIETAALELTRVRELFRYAAANLIVSLRAADWGIWDRWSAFEVAHGTEATYKQMLRYKRQIELSLKEREVLDPSLAAGDNGGVVFVKSSTGPKVTSESLKKEPENPDAIELDIDLD
ncbi:hypothetical protein BABINDRAFT_160466 [Babjeviella inositovora NRRL Y-12698]|uniref:Pre-mRNA-splicing factor SYF1 n=1 Tax=Babjeviella inositovora NRRL Y-12698 TaxID=984486 RepID=A0A1E3QTP0_9ASCO|nr:uncharacterized protein BABINDRAFT_160466 [Babjeviella inositovora NRRL Y-12698]ODQ81049.1 hypothetical protein BABINDRAFT_160466 [Babjeviella inositovora NRRL Y-12698]